MSVANEYVIGTDVTVEGTFRDTAGALIDPTLVKAWVISPSDVETEITPLQNPTVGLYTGIVAADETGVWEYRFVGTGSVNVAGESRFTVQRTKFVN